MVLAFVQSCSESEEIKETDGTTLKLILLHEHMTRYCSKCAAFDFSIFKLSFVLGNHKIKVLVPLLLVTNNGRMDVVIFQFALGKHAVLL